MSKTIFPGFGAGSMPRSSATCGGVTSAKPLPYSPPKGPTNINDPKGPGLHGTNHGNNPKASRR